MLDATFGFSRQNQDVLAADFALGNFGTDTLGHPRHQRRRELTADDPRYAGIPRSFNPGFSAIGNNAGWNPLYRDERTYAFADEHDKAAWASTSSASAIRCNYLCMDHWQPGDVGHGPRGDFTFNGERRRA